MSKSAPTLFSQRFRGYFPIVIDIETAGFNARTDAVLELAASILAMDDDGNLSIARTHHYHIEPFEGANLEQASLDFTGIDPYNPLRGAISEKDALHDLFKHVRKAMKEQGCHRAIMVAHNAAFDQSFFKAATFRSGLKRDPFHPFVTFDTTTLSGLALGQTVLANACKKAGIAFDNKEAHSALYDTERTAQLFCYIVNKWRALGGWPIIDDEEEGLNEEKGDIDDTDEAGK